MELQAMDFARWIDEVRPTLCPPVGNKLLFGGQQKVMVVGGPNARDDYHIEVGEEIFYQLTGAMVVETIEHGVRKAVPIPEGHIFFLPGRVPHSPQRQAGTVGLVIERDRLPHEFDGMRWYHRDSTASPKVLYEEWFHCTDLGTQLAPVIARFKAAEPRLLQESAHVGASSTSDSAPQPQLEIDASVSLIAPVSLLEWAAAHTCFTSRVERTSMSIVGASCDSDVGAAVGSKLRPVSAVLCGPGAVDSALSSFGIRAAVVAGGNCFPGQAVGTDGYYTVSGGDLTLLQVRGGSTEPSQTTVTVMNVTSAPEGAADSRNGSAVDAPRPLTTISLPEGSILLVPGGGRFKIRCVWANCGLCLVVES